MKSQSERSMKTDNEFLFEGQECLSHVNLFVHTSLKVFNACLWYSKDSNACLAGYSDADWVGSVDDRKSTSGGCFYLGNNLVSWMSKKQNFVSLSTAEVEYIAAGSCYTQLLWMKKLLHDYGIP